LTLVIRMHWRFTGSNTCKNIHFLSSSSSSSLLLLFTRFRASLRSGSWDRSPISSTCVSASTNALCDLSRYKSTCCTFLQTVNCRQPSLSRCRLHFRTALSISLSLSLSHTHTHTHTHCRLSIIRQPVPPSAKNCNSVVSLKLYSAHFCSQRLIKLLSVVSYYRPIHLY